MKEARVIKKDEMYYPQYLNTWCFGKYKKWEHFKYYLPDYTLSGNETENLKFRTKHEARYFLRIKRYRL
jgi:hypothetical protein